MTTVGQTYHASSYVQKVEKLRNGCIHMQIAKHLTKSKTI